MPQPRLVCSLWLALLCIVSVTDGYYYYRWMQCYSSSKDLSDMVYIDAQYFNKIKFAEFNSTVGKFVGYTDVGMRNFADFWNKNTAYLKGEQADVERFCKHNSDLYLKSVLDKTVEPVVRLGLVRPASGKHPAMLMCSAYDFYPKMIKLTWYKDGKEMAGDVTSTEELSNGDWYYQIHSHLLFTPKAGEKISCVVEHASLQEPKEIVWDSSMPEPERNQVAIGAAGLVLGLVVCAAGLLYYRKKSKGWILVPPR